MDFKAFLNSLNEEITCTICQEVFGEPKMLQPCMHTVCVDCLNRMANRAIQGRRNAIRCPMCNANIPIPQPEGNFNSLPNNFYIQRLKDMVIIRDAGTQQIKCGNCERKSTDPSYCFDCCGFWCSNCEVGHKIVREYREHRLLALKDFNDDDLGAMLQRPAFCQEQHHKNKLLEFYCSDCAKCLCQMCVVLQHKTHRYQPMEEVAGAYATTITKQVEILKTKIQELLKRKETLQKKRNFIQTNSESAKKEIHNAVQRIIKTLQQQERELVAEIEDTAKTSQAHLKTLSDQITSHVEKLQRHTEILEGIVQRKSSLQILATKTDLDKQFNELNQIKAEINPEADVEVKFVPSTAFVSLKLGHIVKTVHRTDSKRKLKTESGINSASKKQNLPSMSNIRDASASANRSPVSITKLGASGEFVPVKVIGKNGRGNGEFDFPSSVAVNVELNEMAVTHRANRRVQVFDLDGHYLRQFGQEGSGPGMFQYPRGVVYDKENNIVVSDITNQTVSVFTREGRFLRHLATEGNQDGQVRVPCNLSVTDEGNIIVADTGNERIQVFAPDGRLFVKFGDTGNGQLQGPAACVYHRDHYIVTDWGAQCIKVYDRRGQYVKTLILHQENERKPITDITPYGITSTNCGNIIITDVMNHRLVMFRLDGSVIATFGSRSSGLGQFNRPSYVSVLGDKQIIVCDCWNHRLQVLHHP